MHYMFFQRMNKCFCEIRVKSSRLEVCQYAQTVALVVHEEEVRASYRATTYDLVAVE